jgi:hypothetical protein
MAGAELRPPTVACWLGEMTYAGDLSTERDVPVVVFIGEGHRGPRPSETPQAWERQDCGSTNVVAVELQGREGDQ